LQNFRHAIRADEAAVDADFEFHCAVGAATNNHFYLSFLRYMGSFSIPRHSIQADAGTSQERRGYLEGVLGEHRTVADAINAKDATGARDAMRLHLERGRDHYRNLGRLMNNSL